MGGLIHVMKKKVGVKLPGSKNPDEASTFTNKSELICIESLSAAQYLKQRVGFWIILDKFQAHGSNYLQ